MCLIAFALNQRPRYRLVLAANRDEFHAWPSAAARLHRDVPQVFGGRVLAGSHYYGVVSVVEAGRRKNNQTLVVFLVAKGAQ